jgi:peptide/nickel transport system ATP-binding protein
VIVMYAGEVVELGNADEIFHRPSHPYTRGLIDCIPVPGRTRRGEKLGTIPGMVPSLVGAFQGCHFAGRCSRATPVCQTATIPLTPVSGANHLARCIRHHEINVPTGDPSQPASEASA